MLSPLSTKPQIFKIRVPGAVEVHLAINKKDWRKMSRSTDDPHTYQIETTVPANASAAIIVRRPGPGKDYTTLLEY